MYWSKVNQQRFGDYLNSGLRSYFRMNQMLKHTYTHLGWIGAFGKASLVQTVSMWTISSAFKNSQSCRPDNWISGQCGKILPTISNSQIQRKLAVHYQWQNWMPQHWQMFKLWEHVPYANRDIKTCEVGTWSYLAHWNSGVVRISRLTEFNFREWVYDLGMRGNISSYFS